MRTRYIVLVAVVFMLDRISKYVVMKNMGVGESIHVIENFFYLTFVLNDGAAFSIFREQKVFFISVALLIVLVISGYILLIKKHELPVFWGLTLISSGALGNVYDRIVYGRVIDFIDFRFWPVFNIADISIVCGAMILLWHSVRGGKAKNE